MSWKTCFGGQNNIHQDFPALMSDGKFNTNWNTSCANNNRLKREANIINNYDYRQYLQKNGKNLIVENQFAACNNCGIAWNKYNGKNHTKYLFKSCNDKTKPVGYESSDLKSIYLSREELASRTQQTSLTQDQMLKHFNYN
jgi:hypothetical protein|tara:strand:+ start:210 stop:632 length:423 start_codon:yes stop_codon:yes gene_type:complete